MASPRLTAPSFAITLPMWKLAVRVVMPSFMPTSALVMPRATSAMHSRSRSVSGALAARAAVRCGNGRRALRARRRRGGRSCRGCGRAARCRELPRIPRDDRAADAGVECRPGNAAAQVVSTGVVRNSRMRGSGRWHGLAPTRPGPSDCASASRAGRRDDSRAPHSGPTTQVPTTSSARASRGCADDPPSARYEKPSNPKLVASVAKRLADRRASARERARQ